MKTSDCNWLSNNSQAIGFQFLRESSKYAVNNEGDIFSFHKKQPIKMKPGIVGYGYKAVTLILDDGSHKKRYIHHLVIENFIGARPKGMITRHLDGNSLNNNVNNLAYGTNADNENDKNVYGVRHPTNTKLSRSQVDDIRRLKGLKSQASIARSYNMSPMAISRIMRRISWK